MSETNKELRDKATEFYNSKCHTNFTHIPILLGVHEDDSQEWGNYEVIQLLSDFAESIQHPPTESVRVTDEDVDNQIRKIKSAFNNLLDEVLESKRHLRSQLAKVIKQRDKLQSKEQKPFCDFTKENSKFCSVAPSCQGCDKQPEQSNDKELIEFTQWLFSNAIIRDDGLYNTKDNQIVPLGVLLIDFREHQAKQ